ncbi:UV-B-induced protein At3g17800, chloroplastic isoform X1 [Rhododendron vialii]|uniref:UV-B-induced protein At3g17800, chloroplastic isoform X1 n=1 Tax=Rhododendron vialii TaxID=182163 RepID=UPI00265E315F|nr:UV-B-induced protein At3g17800, chloroplastic isoform X1 [Rhododendron vialii]
MDYRPSNANPFLVNNYAVKSSALGLHRLVFSDSQKPRQVPSSVYFSGHRRPLVAVARAGASSNCEFSSLNTPLEPKSAPGKYLSGLLLSDDAEEFQDAVCKQLEQLAADRDDAIRRADLSSRSDEACLHRRIAELREQECQIVVEDIMYILVLYKFHEIKVHLVPRLSKCIYNHRLELWPSNDWELESIHSFEVLELIREHLTGVIGWKADSNVADNWATTEIPRLQLCRVYAASILYGYFLKSASLRHHLELNLGLTCQNPLLVPELLSCGMKNIAFSRIGRAQSTSLGPESCIRVKKRENLKCYVMGFDPETLEMCAKPKTREAVSLVEKHSCALFGDENTGLIETNDVIVTSLSSLKRMVLEAVAFGSFLWDTEEYVDAVYKLKED